MENGGAAGGGGSFALARSVWQAGAGAEGGGGAAVADRLCQYRQPAAGAWSGPPAGNGRARLAGRRPASSPAAGTNGGRAAFRVGWAARHPPGDLGPRP